MLRNKKIGRPKGAKNKPKTPEMIMEKLIADFLVLDEKAQKKLKTIIKRIYSDG